MNAEVILEDLRSYSKYEGRKIRAYEVEMLIDALRPGDTVRLEDLSRTYQIPAIAVHFVIERWKYYADIAGLQTVPSPVSNLNWPKLEEEMESVLVRRLPAEPTFDQCLATIETVKLRIQLMWRNRDVQGKSILVLGDDDHMSICLGLLGIAKEIVVVESDMRIVDSLHSFSQKLQLDLSVVAHDYRFSLPDSLKNRFDVVFVDPPYTIAALQQALKRCIEALQRKEGKICYFCYSPLDVSIDSIQSFQGWVHRCGLLSVELIRNFNEYIDRRDMAEEKKRLGLERHQDVFTSDIARYLTLGKVCNNLTTEDLVQSGFYEYEKE